MRQSRSFALPLSFHLAEKSYVKGCSKGYFNRHCLRNKNKLNGYNMLWCA
jgi:hypothetical protein